jgi:hypothetical protein
MRASTDNSLISTSTLASSKWADLSQIPEFATYIFLMTMSY